MATSNDYWAKRAAKLEERAAKQGDAVAKRALRHYKRAAKEISNNIEAFYGRYAAEQGFSYAEAVKRLSSTEAKAWAKTLGEYVDEINALPDGNLKTRLIAELDARAYSSRITRLDALKAQVDMEIDRLMVGLENEMQEGFGDLYTDSYYRKMFDIQQHAERMFDFAHLNRELVEKALTYPWSGADFSSRLWENKRALLFNLREIMTQGVIQGKGVSVMSKELSDKMGQSFKVAERLIRTEANHFHNAADVAAYEAAGVKQYEFMATLDSRTSAICAGLDGKKFSVADAKTGVNYPPMHPNCRSTTVEYDPDEWQDWEAIGQLIPGRMTYEEWEAQQGIEVPGALKDAAENSKIKLNQTQEYAINRYIGPERYILNAKLRDGTPLTDGETAWVHDLDSALEQFPRYQGELHRTLIFDDVDNLKAFYKKYSVNCIAVEDAYTSASTLTDYHESPTVRILIHSKTGRDLREVNVSEQEVLFPRGTAFFVKNKQIVDGVIEIEVEEVDE